jgi:hypothetical protein
MPHTTDSWWEIELTGDKHALRLVRDVLDEKPLQLEVVQDRHVLRADEWNPISDAGVVRSRAQTLVDSLSGSARLVLGWPAPLEVGRIVRRHPDGRCDYFLEVDSARMELRSFPVTLRVTRADGTVEERGPGDQIRPWLEVTKKNEDARRLLRLISEPELGWVELYRISDLIIGAAGSSVYNWVSKTDLGLFKHTANSVGAVGDEARHGQERSAPPFSPMELNRARRLVLGLSRAWLTSLTTPS